MPRPESTSPVLALLCDADGNLFPSEEPAFEASVGVTNRFLADLGLEVRYDAETLRREALGRNFRALAGDLAREHDRAVAPADLDRWVAEEARVVTAHLEDVLRPDPAVTGTLERLTGRVRLAVVSSSALARLEVCLRATGLAATFAPGDVFSAQDSLPVPTSKPDPAVYRHAVSVLGVAAEAALAVEDAEAGVLSAVAAGVPVVGNLVHVPDDERAVRRRDLLAAGAVAVLDDWAAVEELLAGSLAGAGDVR